MSDYIRFFCETTGHPGASELGWNFMRRMIRFRPVLVASLTGPQMGGRWVGYETLRITPQKGTFVNVVCAAPERWTWLARVPAPQTQLSPLELAAGDESTVEMISARQELWTQGVRNVLIAPPTIPALTPPQIETARKYDAIIVPDPALWPRFSRENARTYICKHPFPEEAVRSLVLGAES